MFKGFGTKQTMFHGFPNLNFQMNNEAYGFSGCNFWLDASSGLNTQTDGGAVSSWVERIKGIKYLQTTAASQPVYRSAWADFNNLPAVDLSAASDYMDADQPHNPGLGFTFAFVCQMATAGLSNLIWHDKDNIAGLRFMYGGTQSGQTGIGFFNGNTAILTSSIEDTSPHIVIMTNYELVIDGVQITTGDASSASSTSYSRIGYISGRQTGLIAEIITFGVVLTSTECIQLSTSINAKYAIY